jgi:hypothetical protein
MKKGCNGWCSGGMISRTLKIATILKKDNVQTMTP